MVVVPGVEVVTPTSTSGTAPLLPSVIVSVAAPPGRM